MAYFADPTIPDGLEQAKKVPNNSVFPRKSLEFELVNSLSVITYIVLTNKLKDITFIWVFEDCR